MKQLIAIITVLLPLVVHSAEKMHELRLGLDDRFTVADTEKWNVTVGRQRALQFADVRIKPKNDSSFSLMMSFICDTPDLAQYDSPEKIEQSVVSTSQECLSDAVEKKIELKKLNTNGWYGCYTVLTDKKTNIPEGKFKYLTRGMVRLSQDSVLGFSLKCNSLDDPQYKELFDYILGFVKPKQAAQPKKSDKDYYESDAYYSKRNYEAAMTELKSAEDADSRWSALNDAAKESFNQGNYADAKSFAEEMKRLAPKYKEKKDWNYGNTVQDFNIVLGRLALKAGDVETAKKRLLAAGQTPGSPQLDSFGPNMSLAKDLLDKGEKTVVLEYFKLCKKFWEMEEGKLEQWKTDIEQNRIPDFGANLDY